MDLRGPSSASSFRTLRTLVRAVPHPPRPGQQATAHWHRQRRWTGAGHERCRARGGAAGAGQGHIPVGVKRGFRGLINGDIVELRLDGCGWMGSHRWLGTRHQPQDPQSSDYYAIARHARGTTTSTHSSSSADGPAIAVAINMYQERNNFPAFNMPIVCVPASINNNLPGADFSIGSDTALNSITEVVDKIKQSAVASNRCFVVEVMGRYCGYLALMSALATGAERAYLHEEGITLNMLQNDIEFLNDGFRHGKRVGLMIRNEDANPLYNTPFLAALFEEEGGDLFDVRMAVLGHLQQGGDPTPYDRILATRLTSDAIDFLVEACNYDAR